MGLLVAWRWELVGGIITMVSMVIRKLDWAIQKGHWLANRLTVRLAIAPPAILFQVAWGLEREKGKQTGIARMALKTHLDSLTAVQVFYF
jgi:hypothetical protein